MPEGKTPTSFFLTATSNALPGLSAVSWEGAQWNDILYFPKNYQIGLIRRGNGTFSTPSGTYPATAGDLFLVHPGRIHRGKPDPQSGWRVESLCLHTDLVASLVETRTGAERRLPLFNDLLLPAAIVLEPFRSLFGSVFVQISQNATGTGNSLADQIHALFGQLAGFFPPDYQTPQQHRAVEVVRLHLETHFRGPLPLDRLANEACLSKYHLLRLFRQQTGVTPHEYLIHRRLSEARRLIFERKSLTEVTLEVGFADQAHFTNAFKKYADGFSPKSLAKTAIFFNFRE